MLAGSETGVTGNTRRRGQVVFESEGQSSRDEERMRVEAGRNVRGTGSA